MTRDEAWTIASCIRSLVSEGDRRRLKAIHFQTRLHDGMVTIRCYFKNASPDDPEPYIFNAEEL